MSDIVHLQERADQLRAAAKTAHDPFIVRALKEVAAEFDREADDEAMHVTSCRGEDGRIG